MGGWGTPSRVAWGYLGMPTWLETPGRVAWGLGGAQAGWYGVGGPTQGGVGVPGHTGMELGVPHRVVWGYPGMLA